MKLYIPLKDGTTLTFDGSNEELIQIAERFVERHGSTVALGPTATHVVNGTEAPPVDRTTPSRRWTEQTCRKLWGLLYGEQAKVVRFLVSKGGSAEYRELGRYLGYGAQHLSGILSPLTRNAQTATGDRLARLVDWRITDAGKRIYFIHPDALPFFQELVKQRQP